MRLELELMEGGETRKRKITNVEYDVVDEEAEQEDDDDEKMEKFFALIRSAKDIRDQLLDAADEPQRPPTKAATTDKKIEAVKAAAEKKAEPVKALRKDKGFAHSLSNQSPPTAPGGGSGGGGVRSSRASSEEEKGKKSAEYNNKNNNKNTCQGGRMVLDLNLSL